MATAVLILSETRQVEYLNASAAALFEGRAAIRVSFDELLASVGAVARCKSASELEELGPASELRLTLADGRLLDGTLRPLSNGGYVLSLDDVTNYVRNAELAHRDPLTGLANRAAFGDRLAERLARASRTGISVALLYVDLDRFKAVNDTLGHPVGDALLGKVAGRLQSAASHADLIARLGGDEFAIVLDDLPSSESATTLAQRLVDLVGRTYVIDGQVLNIGASVGVAISPMHGADRDTLLRNADLALYRGKAEGRNTFRLFDPQMDEQVQQRRTMEIELRRALALKEMRLAYQPQVDAVSGEIVGFEALLRWRQAERGDVSPAAFIPLAEDIGVIDVLGEWVLRTACAQAAAWAAPLPIAVNLSPVQFRNGAALVAVVTSALARSGLPPERLELEITEGALLDDTDAVLRTLSSLRSLGVSISLDDFGTGYSSLAYLRKFAFSKVKIDRSFVQGLEADPGRRSIVRAIVDLARALGMKTIAEGVETEAELACIRAEGCQAVQGYLTGRPMTGEAAAELLRSGD